MKLFRDELIALTKRQDTQIKWQAEQLSAAHRQEPSLCVVLEVDHAVGCFTATETRP